MQMNKIMSPSLFLFVHNFNFLISGTKKPTAHTLEIILIELVTLNDSSWCWQQNFISPKNWFNIVIQLLQGSKKNLNSSLPLGPVSLNCLSWASLSLMIYLPVGEEFLDPMPIRQLRMKCCILEGKSACPVRLDATFFELCPPFLPCHTRCRYQQC